MKASMSDIFTENVMHCEDDTDSSCMAIAMQFCVLNFVSNLCLTKFLHARWRLMQDTQRCSSLPRDSAGLPEISGPGRGTGGLFGVPAQVRLSFGLVFRLMQHRSSAQIPVICMISMC